MKTGPFISVLAKAYGVEEKTVTKFARLLKEEGLLTTGARGVNAPDMTPMDAARLSIALLATDKPSRAVEMVKRFGPFTLDPQFSEGEAPSFAPVDDSPSLEGALAEVFQGNTLASYEFQAVELRANEANAEISHRKGQVTFDGDSAFYESDAFKQEWQGIRVARSLKASDIASVQAIFLRQIGAGM